MEYALPEAIINETLAYLGKRPYEEVWQIVADIKTTARQVTGGTMQVEPKQQKRKIK